MATYEERLAAIQSRDSKAKEENAGLPSYMVASDAANVANRNKTFFESATDIAEDVPKFIVASLISGANQLYNVPANIGNLFGADAELSDTGEVISSLDSNLGAFYEENQQGADLVGFMLSSALPGLGGIRILNAGQKTLQTAINGNKFGTSTAKALGLFIPKKEQFLAKAVKEVATNGSAASITSGNALKAIASGFKQNALEALAFETAVVATMHGSPILENQDFGDFMSNVAWGAGVFGIISGGLDAAKINSALKSAANTASVEARPWTFIPEQAAASTPYEKIALDLEALHDIPPIPAGLDGKRAAFLKAEAGRKVTKLEQRAVASLTELTSGDAALANTLFERFRALPKTTQQETFIGLKSVSTMGAKNKAADRLAYLQRRADKGTATVQQLDEFLDSGVSVHYARMWGEGAGTVFNDAPRITALSDMLKKGEVIKVSGKGVTAGKNKFPFTLAYNKGKLSGTNKVKPWSSLKAKPLQAQARYIWASKLGPLKPTAKDPLIIHADDIPMLEKLITDITSPDQLKHIRITGLDKGEVVGANLLDFVGDRKIKLANRMLSKEKGGLHQEEIASVLNVKSSFLSGEHLTHAGSKYHPKDILAMQHHAEDYTEMLVKQGSRHPKEGVVDIWNVPQHVKMAYDIKPEGTAALAGIDNFVVENMAIIKEQQKLYVQGTSNASASVLGDDFLKLPEINSGRVFAGATPSGAGASLGGAASNNYGTLAATTEFIGRTTADIIETFRTRTRSTLEPLLVKLGNNKEAYLEWSTLQQRVRAIEGHYGLNAAGDALEPVDYLRWKAASAKAASEGKSIKPYKPKHPDMEMRIDIANQDTRNLVKAHIEINAQRTSGLAAIRTAQGMKFNRAPEAFYPIPVNPKDFPHFAMVVDQSITSGNHSKTLYANTAEELEQMMQKLKQNPQYKVYTKNEAEAYYRRKGQFDYEQTLNSNYIDVDAKRKGVSAPFFVSTDPNKIVDDMLNWHMQRETGLVREAVTAKYEVQFEELRRLGEGHTNIATSKFSNQNLQEFAEESVNNPFIDYIKTALAIKKTDEYPLWTSLNKAADKAVSKVLDKATKIVETSKSDAELAEVNRILESAGYKGAAYDASMDIFANASVKEGALTGLVQKANSILATVVLRLDTLNAVNNAVSANVLLGAETSAVMRAIQRGDSAAVGELAKLAKVKVPGTDKLMMAPQKLIANSVRKFNAMDAASSPNFKFYKDNGYITSISDQYRSTLDDLTFRGPSDKGWGARLNDVHKKLRHAADTGEKWTGNKLAEEFNRFVAADVMKQMTDIAVKHNLMDGKEALAYINTFVNRTQGNYLAAQRPLLFQGALGQAIGLFQTYQFNLIQQMLRHVGEGHAKDAMTLLALQGTIHGMNGLPAFNAINTHIIGNASGNTEHKDIYSETYGTVGKDAGDWLMYGAASNVLGLIDPDLKINLYTRGDINPRHLTIVPNSPADVAIVQASGKFFGNLFETAKKLGAGGDVGAVLLQGLEHNGLSRPLAGLAQTLEGLENPMGASYSTSKRGNVIASNDLFSLANLGRVVGGKPLDEAIALDATFRYKAYQAKDRKKRQVLGEAIKSTMLAGKDPSQEQIEDFTEKYVATGGRQEQFNEWFTQLYKTANTSQANKIQQSLTSPFTKSMQDIMGGAELRDFSQTVPE